jgi:hypothetical protein
MPEGQLSESPWPDPGPDEPRSYEAVFGVVSVDKLYDARQRSDIGRSLEVECVQYIIFSNLK